ncbi:hypothetical protein CRG98_002223 [Punica granatum]|uniref:Uncharacterized protein n=1 Tax=Punica granatum TaxID=22663 RepID=A0A2I0L9L2_PUNGR|nr:hypothetical protein CRG98_002223 [Punica granatum]
MLVRFDFNGAIDSLPARPKSGTENVIMAHKDLPYHAVGAGGSDLSVISDNGDSLKGVERQVFVVPDADVGNRRLLVDGVILLPLDRDDLFLDDEFHLLM